MSRTFRRKNYEKEFGSKAGSKVAGYFTQTDRTVTIARVWQTDWWTKEPYKGIKRFVTYTYHKPTREEYFKEYYRIHGDNNRNEWSASRWYRNKRDRQNRSITKAELSRFWKDPENYEVMAEANPRSCLWDWR